MNEHDYLTNRLDEQINWYDQKSIDNQKYYKYSNYATVALTLLISAASYAYDICPVLRYFCILASLIVSFINFCGILNKFHENWINYRSTCEILKHEKYLYLTKSGGYRNSESAFTDLVERCESIISSENVDWAQLHKNKCNP